MRGGRPPRMIGGSLRGALCLVLGALCLPFAACKVVPQDVFLATEVLVAREEAAIQRGKRQWYMPVVSLGGKFNYSRQTQNEIITMNWDDEKSFREGMLAVATATYAIGNAVAKKAEEETARIAAQESTKRAAAAEAAQLNALKESNRHAEALMEFEVAAPVVTPAP